VNWEVSGYTPLAVYADRPADTQPGLNSPGVTLEFGGLWDPTDPSAVPDAAGTLCALRVSEAAQVSITANQARGGVVSALPETTILPVFTAALVDPTIAITGITLTNGIVTITFKGGELEAAPSVSGQWAGTGNTSGTHSEPVSSATAKFFRVHRP